VKRRRRRRRREYARFAVDFEFLGFAMTENIVTHH